MPGCGTGAAGEIRQRYPQMRLPLQKTWLSDTLTITAQEWLSEPTVRQVVLTISIGTAHGLQSEPLA